MSTELDFLTKILTQTHSHSAMEQQPSLNGSDMAPLQGRSPFRLTHCMTEGQITPPSSPTLPSRHGPRLQLSNFFRRSRSVKFKPTGWQDRSRASTIRPSVAEMKAPFPLLLPESPSVTENSASISDLPPGLRRMSTSYHDLRAFARQQAVSSPPTPLLPSPISREPDVESQSYFTFCNPRRRRDSLSDTESIDSEQILTYYCENPKKNRKDGYGYRRESWSCEESQLGGEEEQSTATESMPATPSSRDCCETIPSDESGWLANTTSHEERMRRFKTRFYQVVQHPWTDMSKESGQDEVMIATMLVGPGKPKLVQIQRPPSSQTSQGPEVAQSISGIYLEEQTDAESTQTANRPITPVHIPVEVSAFSPYDTPGPNNASAQHGSIKSFLSTTAYTGSQIKAMQRDVSLSSDSLVPAPLSLPTRTKSTRSDSTVFSSTLQRLQDLADPFGTPSSPPPSTSPSMRKRIRRSRSYHYCQQGYTALHSGSSWPINDFPQPRPKPTARVHGHQYHQTQTSPTLRPATLTRLRRLQKLSHILTAVTRAIDHFLSNISMLRLSSPVVLELRSLHVSEQMYVNTLKRVFPKASDSLLESLAAWILVDLWFEQVRSEYECPDTVRAEYVALGECLSNGRPDSGHGCESGSVAGGNTPYTYWHRYHSPPCQDRHRHQSQNRHSPIPHKALATLGIGTPDVTSIRLSELALHKRAESVTVSVRVVGQRLVEGLRGVTDVGAGGTGWDGDLWRCLRVLVQVVNGGGASGGSVVSARSAYTGTEAARASASGRKRNKESERDWL